MSVPRDAATTLCVDFDGTLFRWGGPATAPTPGAIKAMRRLRRAGWTLVVYTSRLTPPWVITAVDVDREREHIADRLRKHGIPFDAITGVKVPAFAYIDDRAIPFRGDWASVISALDDLPGWTAPEEDP